eukprot:TRINITY_DN3147_c3_g5_i1.p1 TRINITY_DN3147_c3_g5~~TRINITY_DN3147_c3_g5_i1.p1  ORF type:complete len:522 (+),score=231.26 TRINITY_DN3147_c3_g5_i1:87-1568(+)
MPGKTLDYSKWDKMEAEMKKEEQKEDAERERKALYLDPEIPKAMKDKGNELFKKNDLAGAVTQYTSCVVMLTGERDPRAKKPKTEEEKRKEKEKQEAEEKRQERMRDKDVKMPSGVTVLDPDEHAAQAEAQAQAEREPLQECAAGAFRDDIDDEQLELRMVRCQRRMQLQPELKQLLAQTYCNRANCEFKLSEGKDTKFKEKIKGTMQKKVPGGADRWDNYKVRMTFDALNDSRAACILDPNYARAWYRIGACIERLIFLIDRLRERKAWLREDEIPILDKPNLYKEADEALRKSLEIDPQPETHKLLVQIVEDMQRIPTFVRKMGHEKLCCDFDDKMILTDVDEKGPSGKWRLDYYKGMRLLRVRVEKGGATARDYELRRDPVWVEVQDLKHLIKEQTHASKVDLEFEPLEKPKEVASWECYAPKEGDAPSGAAKRHGKYGKPPPRRRGGSSSVGPVAAASAIAISFLVLLWMLISAVRSFASSTGAAEQEL